MKMMMISLGCEKNLVDSQMMLGIMADHGYEMTDDEYEAEIIIINTCSFIQDAKEESIDTIIEYGHLKEEGSLKCLVCTGCLAQRYVDELKSELPEVDVILGVASFDHVAEAVEDFLAGKNGDRVDDVDSRLVYGEHRVLTGGGYSSYLKIAEGCNKKCTYCAIPSFRGEYKSVPMEVLVKEAEELANKGVKELIIVAQETTVYGIDLYGEKRLHLLLKELCAIEGLEWIRLMYCYPEEIYDELIAVMASEQKLCHYIDMPIQHSEDRILQKMGRRTDKAFLKNIVDKLRKAIPDIIIRTTLITGFPGETDEEFEGLLEFIKEERFDRLGVFAYSAEEGTIAAEMPDQIDEDTKEARKNSCMEIQQEIAFEKASAMIGKEMRVMVEGRVDEDEGALVCRSYMDSPEIDGFIFVPTNLDLMSGTMIDVIITESHEYDLIGEIKEDEST